MNELNQMLVQVSDSYYGFIIAATQYAQKSPRRTQAIINYIKNNPSSTTSDILYFISHQPDFYEDASRVLSFDTNRTL